MRYNVVMDATKPTSLRIPDEIIAFAEEIAKAKEWSRAKVLVRSIECGLPLVGNRTLKGYQQNHDQAEANLIKAVRNGKSGEKSGEAGNHSEVDERGVGGGVAESDAGVVLTGRVRSVAGGGGGAAFGAKKASGKGKSVAGWVAPQENAKAAGVRGWSGGDVSAGWFPNSMCPHGWMNSFACEKAGGGCVR
jgi:hypothetical protein